jgi:hypothetical protein
MAQPGHAGSGDEVSVEELAVALFSIFINVPSLSLVSVTPLLEDYILIAWHQHRFLTVLCARLMALSTESSMEVVEVPASSMSL